MRMRLAAGFSISAMLFCVKVFDTAGEYEVAVDSGHLSQWVASHRMSHIKIHLCHACGAKVDGTYL